jgi:predicted nucleotidyltransferase
MNEIGSVVSDIKKEKGVEAIFLFGSHASGNAKPYSDIDLCVITGEEAKREMILRNSSDKIDTNIFWDLPLNVRFRVIKEGKPLYIRNKLNMHRIRVSTVLQYLDFKPLLDRHFSRILGG